MLLSEISSKWDCCYLLPRDVRDDDTVRPEEDVGRLAVVGEVLDVDRLLVQHEDVPGDLSLVGVRSRDTEAASDWSEWGHVTQWRPLIGAHPVRGVGEGAEVEGLVVLLLAPAHAHRQHHQHTAAGHLHHKHVIIWILIVS